MGRARLWLYFGGWPGESIVAVLGRKNMRIKVLVVISTDLVSCRTLP